MDHEMIFRAVFVSYYEAAVFARTCEARVVWKWTAHLVAKARALHRRPLFINFDETSTPLVHVSGKGNVMVVNGRRAWQANARQRLRGGERRMNFTTLAFICNIPEIQPLLPQVIFAAASMLRVGEWNDICENLPHNVDVKRMPSAWNTAQQHLVVLRLLKLILEPLMHEYQPIVFFDAAPLHLRAEVLELMRNLGLWYVIIPARLTWLLQPCDTHVFLKLKRFIKSAFQDEFGDYGERRSIVYMIRLVVRAVRHVLQRYNWHSAFQANGLTSEPNLVSSYIRAQIQQQDLQEFPDDAPDLNELALCFHEMWLFQLKL